MFGDIAAAATALGVLIALFQFEAERRQRRAGFEEELTKRYWAILDGLSLDLQRGQGSPTEQDCAQAHAYFRLSDEQIYQALTERRVSKRVWRMWADGITASMLREPFAGEWRQLGEAVKEIHYGDLRRLLDDPLLAETGYKSWLAWRLRWGAPNTAGQGVKAAYASGPLASP